MDSERVDFMCVHCNKQRQAKLGNDCHAATNQNQHVMVAWIMEATT